MYVEEREVEAGGASILVRWAVPGSAPVASPGPPQPVYLHGPPTDGGDWEALLLRTGGIAPDLPGFGRSGKGGHHDYTPDGLAATLSLALDACELTRVALVAHGWSAEVALRLLARHPGRVGRLVLCSPRLARGEPLRLERWLRRPVLGELTMGSVNRRLLRRWLLAGAAGDAVVWPPERVEQLWREFDQGTQRAILRLLRGAAPAPGGPSATPAAPATPAMILVGERDPWVSRAEVTTLAATLPGARVESFAAGHWPWLVDPAAAERIAAFVTGSEPT